MTSERCRVRFITLAAEDQRPLGVVAYGGADWTFNCGQSAVRKPQHHPDAGVMELLIHIERAHPVGGAAQVVEVSWTERCDTPVRKIDGPEGQDVRSSCRARLVHAPTAVSGSANGCIPEPVGHIQTTAVQRSPIIVRA